MSSLYPALLRLFSALAIIFSIVGLILSPNPLTTPAATSPPGPRPVPHTDVNPLGANFFLDREVEQWKREQTLKMAREAGIGWVKMLFSWEGIEPRKGQFWEDKTKKSTWEKFDEIVALCQKYGLRIIARLDRPPDWTRADNRYKTTPPDNFEDYGRFVAAVVSRYKGRIQNYEIWNEPNIWPEWGDRAVDPKGYVELLKVAYKAAKEADPNALILSAPLAQTLEKTTRNLSELDYLDAMYKAGAKDYFDILFANGYGFEFPPSAPPDPNVLNLQRIKLLREVMVRHGDDDKPIWLNEFGWNASPPDFPKDKLIWRRVTEEEQANYIAEGIRLARSWGWIGVINVWYFRQVGDFPTDRADYYFRVVDTDFTPRLVYYKLKEIGASLQVAAPGYYEETNPAVKVRGNWIPLLKKDASGGGVFASSNPGDTITLTFQGTGVNLVYFGDEASGRLSIKVDGRSYEIPSGKNKGSTYVELFHKDKPGPAKETIVEGLPPGRHTLELTVSSDIPPGSQGRLCTIDAFEVVNEPSFWLFYALSVLLVLGLLGLISSFFLRRAD